MSRASHLRTKFGITVEQYDQLLADQGGGCFICGKTKEQEGKNLAVDHDHITGEIRGILCSYHNHRVIGRHRDGDLLRKMAEYVERRTGLFIPSPTRSRRKRKKNVAKINNGGNAVSKGNSVS
jgi:hypothetical protein